MLACSHFHSAGGRTVDVMCSDGEGFSACRKKRLPGVMWGGAPPWLSRFHTRCHLTSPWWQWRKIIMVVCNIVTAQERNSFLSTCILYSLFLRKRFQIFHTRDNAIPLQEHVPGYHICHKRIVIAIPCYGRTHQIQPNQPTMPSLCPATYLLTLNFNPCVVHDICPALQDVSNTCFLQATSTSPCYISLFTCW